MAALRAGEASPDVVALLGLVGEPVHQVVRHRHTAGGRDLSVHESPPVRQTSVLRPHRHGMNDQVPPVIEQQHDQLQQVPARSGPSRSSRGGFSSSPTGYAVSACAAACTVSSAGTPCLRADRCNSHDPNVLRNSSSDNCRAPLSSWFTGLISRPHRCPRRIRPAGVGDGPDRHRASRGGRSSPRGCCRAPRGSRGPGSSSWAPSLGDSVRVRPLMTVSSLLAGVGYRRPAGRAPTCTGRASSSLKPPRPARRRGR